VEGEIGALIALEVLEVDPSGRAGFRIDRTMLAVSVCGSLLVHSLVLLGLLVARLLGIEPGSYMAARADEPAPVGIVPARLVRLGEQPEPGKMPDRMVPALPTAPDEGVPVSTEMQPPEPTKQRAKRPRNPVEDDKVRDVLSRIRAFGEVTDNVTTAGDPSGVAGGDVADPALASKGSLWAREIHEVMKAYLSFPTIITEEELGRLRCKIEVKVGPDLIPREAKLDERGWSGNRFFDQAVLDSFETMRLKRVELPPPPRELEAQFFRYGLKLTVYGRDLN
jgi:hypothetical protein